MTDTADDTEEDFPEELKRRERLQEPEGLPKGNACPHYPCHFKGQACAFCYCPKYPCEDRKLGRWIKSSKGDVVWTCISCTLLHKKRVADYLLKHPDASLEELKQAEAEQ